MIGKLARLGLRLALRRRDARKAQEREDALFRRMQLERGIVPDELDDWHRPTVRSAVRSVLHRGRKILAPFTGLFALWLAGLTLGHTLVTPAGVGGLWAILACLWLGWKRRSLARAEERWYAVALWAGAGVWLVATRYLGVWTTDTALFLAGGLAAVPWLRHHWPRNRPADPEPVAADDLPARWAANVAPEGRAAPGSTLSNYALTEHYELWDLQLRPGASGQTLDGLLGSLPQIAAGTREPQERLLIEPHPHVEDPSQLQLKRLRHSPIEEIEYMRTPQYEDGRVLLGRHVDRIGSARWRVYTKNSMWSGFIAGGTGSGKTTVSETIAITVRWAWMTFGIPTAIIYLDGQNGASSPRLREHATWSGGPDDVDMVLDALGSGAATRQSWNRLHGLSGFTPGHCPDGAEEGLTGLLVVADEFHALCPDKHKAARWAKGVREWRKVGLGVVALDQSTELQHTFGNNEVLRASLLDGNGSVHRLSSNTQGSTIPGLPFSPAKLPAIPGYGYKISAPKSGERTAPYRARFLPSATDVGDGLVLPDGVRTSEDWFASTEDAPIDAMTMRALGPAFEQREEHKQLALENDRARVEGREVVVAGAVAGPVLVDAGKKTPAREQILAMMRRLGRAVTRQEMLAETGVTDSAITQAVRGLLEERLIVRVGQGEYDLAERVTAAA